MAIGGQSDPVRIPVDQDDNGRDDDGVGDWVADQPDLAPKGDGRKTIGRSPAAIPELRVVRTAGDQSVVTRRA